MEHKFINWLSTTNSIRNINNFEITPMQRELKRILCFVNLAEIK